MKCVRANREDHDFLDHLENNSENAYFLVDCYNKVSFIKTGEIFILTNGTETLKILWIGRMGSSDKKKSQRYLQEYERLKLSQLSNHEHVDILFNMILLWIS